MLTIHNIANNEMSQCKTYKLEETTIEIIDGDRGKNYPKQHEFYPYEYCLFLNTGNVTPAGFNFGNCQFITKDKDHSLRKGKIRRNDIVLTTRGTVGNAGFYNQSVNYENIRINSGMVIIRCNPAHVSPSYLYQFIKSPLFKISVANFSTGSAQPQLPIRDLKQIEIPLPELPTQNRIAEILSALDDKIELNRRMNQTMEQMAQTLFRHYFVDGIDADNLPEGWRLGKVLEICFVNNKTLSKSNHLPWLDYVEISSVGKGCINSVARYLRGDEPSRARRILSHGDTVISTVRPDRGAYFLAIQPYENLIASTGLAVFSAKGVPFSFLYLLLTQEEFFKYYGFIANGAAYPAINPESILDMEVVIPPLEVLNDFHSKSEALLLKFHSNIQESKTLSNLRDTLLPKLMSGEIDVMQTKTAGQYEEVLS